MVFRDRLTNKIPFFFVNSFVISVFFSAVHILDKEPQIAEFE